MWLFWFAIIVAPAVAVNVVNWYDFDIVLFYLLVLNAYCPSCTVSLKLPRWRRVLGPSSLLEAIFVLIIVIISYCNTCFYILVIVVIVTIIVPIIVIVSYYYQQLVVVVVPDFYFYSYCWYFHYSYRCSYCNCYIYC